jgi:hypothetical protein
VSNRFGASVGQAMCRATYSTPPEPIFDIGEASPQGGAIRVELVSRSEKVGTGHITLRRDDGRWLVGTQFIPLDTGGPNAG